MSSKFPQCSRRWAQRFSTLHTQVSNRRKITMRALDGLESLFHEYYKKGIGFSYLLTPINSKIPIEADILRRALVMVSCRQPLLRATIKETPKMNYFICNDEHPNFQFCVMDKEVADVEEITEEVFEKTKFESGDGALWKVTLIPGKYDRSTDSYKGVIVLAVSHAVANAPSLVVILKQSLEYLEQIHKGTKPSLKCIESAPLYSNSATLLSHKLQKMNTSYNPSPNYINPVLSQFPTIEDNFQKTAPKTKVIVRKIPADRALFLLQQCRGNNSTITGALLAACHVSFMSFLNGTDLPTTSTNDLTCLAAVNSEHQPRLPIDYVGCHYGALTYDIPIATSYKNFWQLAHVLSSKLREDTKGGKHLEFLSKIESDYKEFMKGCLHQGSLRLANRQKSSLIVSNVGNFKVENTSEQLFHPQEFIVGTPIHKRFGTFGNYIMSLNGVINYMFCYDSSIISKDVACKYADGVWDALQLYDTDLQGSR